MTNYSKRIIELRKNNNLTQAELGAQLNVTPQAISKWEKGQSEPDLQTIQKICELYNVSIDWILGKSENQQNATNSQGVGNPNIIKGYCDICGKPVSTGEYVVSRDFEGVQEIVCKECEERIKKEKNINEKKEIKRQIKKGFIWGGVVGVILMTLFIWASITSKDIDVFTGGLIITIPLFTFITQMHWDRSVKACLGFFLRSFSMPGVIFDLSLDGLIFLVAAKLILAVIGWVLSGIVFIIGLIISMIYSVISFPFATVNIFKEYKN